MKPFFIAILVSSISLTACKKDKSTDDSTEHEDHATAVITITSPNENDTIQGKKGGHLAFEIPVVADLNIGLHSASDDARRSLGLYVGGGYQYSYTKVYTSVGKVPFDSFDPVFRAGLRMGKSWETRWSLGFNMRGVSGGNRTYSIHWLKEL